MDKPLGTLTLGAVIARANNPLRHAPVDLGSPVMMTDRQLEDNHADLVAQVVNIARQLADDHEMDRGRGDGWRKRALGARRVHLAQIDRLVVEGRRRRLAFAGQVHAPAETVGLNGQPLPPATQYAALALKREARERQMQIEAEAHQRKVAEAERRAQARLEFQRLKAETHATTMAEQAAKREVAAAHLRDRERRQERCFVSAALDMLGVDAAREIWARAREMFPDPAIWSD